MVMTLDDLTCAAMVQMHGTAKTVFVDFAIGTDASTHPAPVAERLETIFPYVEEVVLVDVALNEQLAVDVRTG